MPEENELTEEVQDELEDLSDELTELFAAQDIIQEQRISTITERLDKWQTQLEQLSASQTAENPVLTSLMTQVAELRGEVLNLKSSLDTIATNQQQFLSRMQESERSTEEHAPEEQPALPPEAEEPQTEPIPASSRKNRRFL